MRMKRILTGFCCLLLLLCLTPAAQAKGMTASIATGPVVMNGQQIDSGTARYPLLVYSDITYVPMTYDLSRFMGLATEWDSVTQTLSIDRSRDRGPYVPDTGHGAKSGSVSVTRVVTPVIVGGVSIDNALEADYPLFLYQGVTYFPLTNNFMVSSFGWTYSWNMNSGLTVSSDVRPPLPSEAVDTGRPDLDAALESLNALHRQSHVYAGTLADRQDGSTQKFTARTTVVTDTFGSNVELRADPFVFFDAGGSITAQYHTEAGLAGESSFTTGWDIPREYGQHIAPPSNNGTEKAYLAYSFLDCQFSGKRTEKILSASQDTQDGLTVWRLTAAFELDDFTGYDAAITLKDGDVSAIEISTENYTMHLDVTA